MVAGKFRLFAVVLLGLVAVAPRARADVTTLNIDVYVTVQPSVPDGLAQAFTPDGAVVVPLSAFGTNGTAAFNATYQGATNLKSHIDTAFQKANEKFKDADVRFVVRSIMFIRADQADLRPFYDAENDVFDLKKDEDPSLVGAFAHATRGTTDAFRMLIAPLTDNEPEQGLAQTGGTVSVIGNGRAFESRDNGFIVVHELTHNLGIAQHGGDGLHRAMAASAPDRTGSDQNREADPALSAGEISTIRDRITKGRYRTAQTTEGGEKKAKSTEKSAGAKDGEKSGSEAGKKGKDGKIAFDQPPQVARAPATPADSLIYGPSTGFLGQLQAYIEVGLCGGRGRPVVTGTQTVAGNTNVVRTPGSGDGGSACLGAGLLAASGPAGSQTRAGPHVEFIDKNGSTIHYQRDSNTNNPHDTMVHLRRGDAVRLGLTAERELGSVPCGIDSQRCTVGLGVGGGVAIQDVSVESSFDQTCCGGGVTRMSKNGTLVRPYVQGSAFVSAPLRGLAAALDLILTLDYVPSATRTVTGTDGFNQPISDQVEIPGGTTVMARGRVRFQVEGREAYSDMRLKRDITLLAPLARGIGLYGYRFAGENRRHVGVIAQEVMRTMPEAVRRRASGYYMVDYGAVFADPAVRTAFLRSGYTLAP